jgi:hypothetical protein
MNRELLRADLTAALARYETTNGALPGITRPEYRATLVEQLVSSVRRTLYLAEIVANPGAAIVADPSADAFNPLRAAVLQDRAGNRDEAFWLVFLYIHFGFNRRSEWHMIADIYGRLDGATPWSWDAVAADVDAFRHWLDENTESIMSRQPRRVFGNHRKYESLGAWNESGTGAVVESYVSWVGAAGHDARIAQVLAGATTDAQRFEALYASVRTVRRFGRTGAFDYSSTLARLALVAVEPNAACLDGATGPLKGARLLLSETGKTGSPTSLEASLAPLRTALDVGFDVLEDALCNWQKSPAEFKRFRG